MHRISLILDGKHLDELSSRLCKKAGKSLKLNVKDCLGTWLQEECEILHLNGFIQSDPDHEDVDKRAGGYLFDGQNEFVSPHIIEFFDINCEKDNELSKGLKSWLSICDLIFLERSLFPMLFEKIYNDINVLMPDGDNPRILIFGHTNPTPAENMKKGSGKCVTIKLVSGIIEEQIKEVITINGKKILDDIRKQSQQYFLCLDDQLKELEQLEYTFSTIYPDAFFHGLPYNDLLDVCPCIEQILQNYGQDKPFVIFLDQVLSLTNTGDKIRTTLQTINNKVGPLQIVLFSGDENQTASDCFSKPTEHNKDEFKTNVEKVVNQSSGLVKAYSIIHKEEEIIKNSYQPEEDFGLVYAKNGTMEAIVQTIKRINTNDSIDSVLISGETGTGKERVAQLLHKSSSRSEKSFVPINCAAFPDELIEAELFGHEKGAFTHAVKSRPGVFSTADGGTIFLDEIGEITEKMQVKLLRVLQDKEFLRIGCDTPIKVDVRILAGTNCDLATKVGAGEFREDLYQRLQVVPLHIPPLRERKEDIIILSQYFLKEVGCTMSDPSKILLMSYDWPGNVRELENVIRGLVAIRTNNSLKVVDFVNRISALKTDAYAFLIGILQTMEGNADLTGPGSTPSDDHDILVKYDEYMEQRIQEIRNLLDSDETITQLSGNRDENSFTPYNPNATSLLEWICQITSNPNKSSNGKVQWRALRKIFKTPEKDVLLNNLPSNIKARKAWVKKCSMRLVNEVPQLQGEWLYCDPEETNPIIGKKKKKIPSVLQRTFIGNAILNLRFNE